MMGPLILDHCIKLNYELPSGKKYYTEPLEFDSAQDLHYQHVTRMAQEDLGMNAAADSLIKLVYSHIT